MQTLFNTASVKNGTYLNICAHVHGKRHFDSCPGPDNDPQLSIVAFRWKDGNPVVDSYVAWQHTVPFNYKADDPDITKLEKLLEDELGKFLGKDNVKKGQIAALRAYLFS